MGLPVPCPKFGDNVYNAVKNARFNRIKIIFAWSLQSQQTRIGKQVQGEQRQAVRAESGGWTSRAKGCIKMSGRGLRLGWYSLYG